MLTTQKLNTQKFNIQKVPLFFYTKKFPNDALVEKLAAAILAKAYSIECFNTPILNMNISFEAYDENFPSITKFTYLGNYLMANANRLAKQLYTVS